MPIVVHPTFLLMKYFGIPYNSKGECCGISMAEAEAEILGAIVGKSEVDKHENRLAEISSFYQRANSSHQWVKEAVGPTIPDDIDEDTWLKSISNYQWNDVYELKAYLEKVVLYSNINSQHQELWAKDFYVNQYDTEILAAVAESELTKQCGGLHVIERFSGVYNIDRLKHLLKSFATMVEIQARLPRYPLLIASKDHQISITYLVDGKTWRINSHNRLFTSCELDKIAQNIMDTMNHSKEQNALILGFLILGLDRNLSETNGLYLQKIQRVNNAIRQWRSSKAFDEVHRKTLQVDYRDIAQNNITLLHMAAKINDLNAVERLFEFEALNPNLIDDKGYTPLLYAAYYGQEKIVAFLLGQGAKVDIETQQLLGLTILHFAALRGHGSVVQRLIAAGAPIHMQTKDKTHATPLMLAAKYGRGQVVRILLQEEKKYLDAKLINDQTALLTIAIMRHGTNNCLEIIEVLLKAGEKANEKNYLGIYTAFSLAVFKGHRDIVTLIAGHENIQEKDSAGNTALHNLVIAATYDSLSMDISAAIELLIQQGIKVNDKNKMGKTALDLSLSHHNPIPPCYVESLLKAGAKKTNENEETLKCYDALKPQKKTLFFSKPIEQRRLRSYPTSLDLDKVASLRCWRCW